MATTAFSTRTPVPTSVTEHQPNDSILYNYNIYYNNNYNNTVSLSLSVSLNTIGECMRQTLGYLPNENTREQLMELLDLGAQVDLICAVLEYTKARAPRPSWAYAYKVAMVHVKQGNVSADAFNASVREFWSNKTEKASYVPGYFNVSCPYDREDGLPY